MEFLKRCRFLFYLKINLIMNYSLNMFYAVKCFVFPVVCFFN